MFSFKNHEIDGLDMSVIEEVFQNRDQIAVLLNIFVKKQRTFCEEIQHIHIETEEFRIAMHKLKGACGTIGANKIHALISTIEIATDAAYIDTLLQRLCQELETLIVSIEATLAN